MKKVISLLAVILMTFCFSFSVSAEDADLPDYALFAKRINSTYASYFGNTDADFDFNEDGAITAHDLTLAKREMLENPKACITKATIQKFFDYLTGEVPDLKVYNDTPLEINKNDSKYSKKESWIKNLNSKDFRIVGADICKTPGDLKIYYLGIDEYVKETLIIPYTAYYMEHDEIIVNKKDYKILYTDKGFVITDAKEPLYPEIGKPLIGFNFKGIPADAVMDDIEFINDLMQNAEEIFHENEDFWYFTTSSVDVEITALPAETTTDCDSRFCLVIENNEVRVYYTG